MYKKPFYIDLPVGNNALSSDKRIGRKLFVPDIIKGRINDLIIGKEIVFEEIDEKGEIISFNGLKNFVRTEIFGIPAIIFDNHNHSFYFWFEKVIKDKIEKVNLIHIDEHSDLAVPDTLFRHYELVSESVDPEINSGGQKTSLQLKNNKVTIFGSRHSELVSESIINFNSTNNIKKFLQKIFEYTNFSLNVGNYIVPFLKSGIVENFFKVTSESELEDISNYEKSGIFTILNLDIDFFSSAMEYIDYNKKKEIIRKIAKKSDFITIATSPFFIDQKKAIEVIKDIFVEN